MRYVVKIHSDSIELIKLNFHWILIEFPCLQDPLAGASKRTNAGDAASRPKASKKDLTQNDIEQAIRNGRVIQFWKTIFVFLI